MIGQLHDPQSISIAFIAQPKYCSLITIAYKVLNAKEITISISMFSKKEEIWW